jgi:hypothetical protein
MPDRLSIHKPVLVNTIGHCAGAVVFGILLYLLLVNWRRSHGEQNSLAALAAALAMLWNVGSLIALAGGPDGGMLADVSIAASFSILSLLPAVLLHISLKSSHRALWISGYVLSLVAATLHIADLVTHAARFHYAGLRLVMFGFGALTAISVFLDMRQEDRRAAGSRLAGAMALFLFAISFVHFGSDNPRQAWSKEIALHHAGLPLALLVLLQDYRFLLLDTFVRFIVNASLAAGAVVICIGAWQSRELETHVQHPFEAGLLFVAACLLLALFVYVRNRMQRLLTQVIFLRSNVEEPLQELQHLARAAQNEVEYLNQATETVGRFLHANRFELIQAPDVPDAAPPAAWVQAIVPLRLSGGDTRCLLLGPRRGGRRYLSEDYEVLHRLASAMIEHVEHFRVIQMQNLVAQAELRALQAQINPHFFFNSLNTLYGTIARENTEARRLVLNLADSFRYFLQSDRPFIQVEEELRLVRAYLEIEELRLGPRLRVDLDVDPAALHIAIPVLSIQPLVENAVKHGVAAREGNGFVGLSVRTVMGQLRVDVSNSGEFKIAEAAGSGPGIGLSNVRRRLALHYGEGTGVDIRVADGVTTVGFAVPAGQTLGLAVAV